MFNINKEFLKDKKEKKEEEKLYYKEIYDYSLHELDSLYERKRHIEIKSLYTLQASAIVITLFSTLIKFTDIPSYISIILIFAFYCVMVFGVFLLLLSLKDTILKYCLIRHIVDKLDKTSVGINVKGIKDADKKYIETPRPYKLLKYENIQKHYKDMAYSISRSIYSLNRINIAKDLLLKMGLDSFVISICIVILLGILVA